MLNKVILLVRVSENESARLHSLNLGFERFYF